jgi:hypothetical protein
MKETVYKFNGLSLTRKGISEHLGISFQGVKLKLKGVPALTEVSAMFESYRNYAKEDDIEKPTVSYKYMTKNKV